MRFLSPLLVMLLLMVSACDSSDVDNGDDDDDGGPENSASVTVTGALDAEYDAIATFVTVLNISHAITMVLENNKGTIVLSSFGSADEGTYNLQDANQVGIFGASVILQDLAGQNNNPGVVSVNGGSVTITDRSDTRIRGRFTANGQTVPGNEAVTVSGSFDASCIVGVNTCIVGG